MLSIDPADLQAARERDVAAQTGAADKPKA
jgi:hypothetical protein